MLSVMYTKLSKRGGGGRKWSPPCPTSGPCPPPLPSDLDLSPEGLLDVLGVFGTPPGFDGQGTVATQGRGDGGGIHILRQLALVSESVHDGPVGRQLHGGKTRESGWVASGCSIPHALAHQNLVLWAGSEPRGPFCLAKKSSAPSCRPGCRTRSPCLTIFHQPACGDAFQQSPSSKLEASLWRQVN